MEWINFADKLPTPGDRIVALRCKPTFQKGTKKWVAHEHDVPEYPESWLRRIYAGAEGWMLMENFFTQPPR